MKRYETIVIADPEVSEENRTALFERYQGIVSQGGGLVVEVDTWGSRPLAYEIKKKRRGFYFRLDYCGAGALVDEIERFSRIDDRILKFLTVLTNSEADPEQVKAEMAAKKAAEEARHQEKTESAETPVPPEKAQAEPQEQVPAEAVAPPDETPSEE